MLNFQGLFTDVTCFVVNLDLCAAKRNSLVQSTSCLHVIEPEKTPPEHQEVFKANSDLDTVNPFNLAL